MPQISELAQRRQIPSPSQARAIRRSGRISQAELAQAIGVDRVTVARWEMGIRTPKPQLAERYREALDAILGTLDPPVDTP